MYNCAAAAMTTTEISAGREINTGQSAAILCGWEVKASFRMWINVWVAGKTV